MPLTSIRSTHSLQNLSLLLNLWVFCQFPLNFPKCFRMLTFFCISTSNKNVLESIFNILKIWKLFFSCCLSTYVLSLWLDLKWKRYTCCLLVRRRGKPHSCEFKGRRRRFWSESENLGYPWGIHNLPKLFSCGHWLSGNPFYFR